MPVGAISLMIIEVGIRCGFRCGASAGAGAATADLAYSLAAVVGGAALAATVEGAGAPLRWISAGVLILLALKGLVRTRSDLPTPRTSLPVRGEHARTYAKFLGLTIINPMTVVYFAAVVVGLGVADDLDAGGAALFAVGAFCASLSWQLLLAGIGAVAGHRLPPRFRMGAIVLGNLVIIAMALLILLR